MSGDDRTHNLKAEGWRVKGCLLLSWTAGLGNGLANTAGATPLPTHFIPNPNDTRKKTNTFEYSLSKAKTVLIMF